MSRLSLLLVFVLLSSPAFSATIQWTGSAGNSLWNFANNWLGNAVPTGSDDVVINALGGSSVSISQPAVANSITIAGGQYGQTLTLLSSLTIGAGGIRVQNGGILQVQSNNNLPLTSSGPVTAMSGSQFVFLSGAIIGPGAYTVNQGAQLSFSQSALKLINGANLTNFGIGTIQPSTIEIEKNGVFNNRANLTVVGSVNIFSIDNTGEFNNYGGFNYEGSVGSVLTLQLNTYFYSLLNIVAGSVNLEYNFKSNSTVNLPSGSVLIVAAGTSVKNLNIIRGNGELLVEGIANINAPLSLTTVVVTDSGTLTFNAQAAFQSGSVAGIVNAQAGVTYTNLTLAGGTLTGPGSTQISSHLWINPSDTGNTNNFISSAVTLFGMGQSSLPIYLLLGNGGQFHIAQGASYNILSTFSFGVQAGKPLVIVDGTLSASLAATQTITTNVDISGAGSIKINSGSFVANGDILTIGSLTLATMTTATLNTVVLTAGIVSGAGNLNLTAAPTPVSSISTIATTFLGIPNGNVNIGSFAVTTLDFWSGAVTLAASSSNTATTFNYFGGALSGAAKLTTNSLTMQLSLPAVLSGVAIKTNTFTLTGSGSVQYSNGATIVAGGASSSGPTISRGGVVIN